MITGEPFADASLHSLPLHLFTLTFSYLFVLCCSLTADQLPAIAWTNAVRCAIVVCCHRLHPCRAACVIRGNSWAAAIAAVSVQRDRPHGYTIRPANRLTSQPPQRPISSNTAWNVWATRYKNKSSACSAMWPMRVHAVFRCVASARCHWRARWPAWWSCKNRCGNCIWPVLARRWVLGQQCHTVCHGLHRAIWPMDSLNFNWSNLTQLKKNILLENQQFATWDENYFDSKIILLPGQLYRIGSGIITAFG